MSGGLDTGGLVGFNYGAINTSYATGHVSGSTTQVGGLVGAHVVGGTVSNSFWDTTTSGQTTSAGGRGMVTSAMQSQANFNSATTANGNVNPGWDFSGTWVISGQNYPTLIGVTVTVTGALTPLTITANNVSKTYNGSAFTGDSNGVTYSIAGAAADFSGSVAYSGTSQGVINVGGGTFSIIPGGLQQTTNLYLVTYGSGTLTMNPLALSGSIAVGNSVYGASLAPGVVTFANAIGSVTAGTVAVNTTNLTSSSGNLIAGTHIGIESVGSTLGGANAGDYTFAGATGNYTVTPLALTGSIATGSSVYGSALTPGLATFSNALTNDLLGTQTIAVNTTGHTSTSGHLTAGTRNAVEALSALSGADGADYSFAALTGSYTVTPLALTGSIATGSSVYGLALTPGAANFSNALTNDLLGTATVAVNTAGLTSTSGHLTAGTHSAVETLNALSGADGADYSFAALTGNYTVTPLALTGSIATGSSVYGSALVPGAVSFANVIGGDAVTAGYATVTTANQVSTGGRFTAGSHPGSESVGSTLNGADAGDYTFSGTTGNYTVNPLTLSVAASGVNKVYDGTTADAATLSSSGVLPGDQVSLTAGTANFASKNVGSGQALAVSDISINGADAGDYALNSTSAVTAATISPAALTVSGVAASNKVYDGTAAAVLAGGSLVGVVAGDTGLVALTDVGRFASPNAGTGIAVTAVGTLTGGGAGNYVLVQPSGLNANITPATLSYEATPATRTAGQSLAGLSGSLSGFVAGETPANATVGTLAWTTPADAGSRAGQYAIDGGGLTADNYLFVEAPGNATALTLQPAAAPPVPIPPPAPLPPPPAPLPPVTSTPTLPSGGSSAIAAMQATLQMPPAESPDALAAPVTLIAAQDVASLGASGDIGFDSIGGGGDPEGSSGSQPPVADIRRMIGTTPLRIVSGGVRLPQ